MTADIIDLGARRERRVDLIKRLRGRGMGVAEVALLAKCAPKMVERVAPTYTSPSEVLIEKWERRRLRRQARRERRG